jgi:hypothetical protein
MQFTLYPEATLGNDDYGLKPALLRRNDLRMISGRNLWKRRLSTSLSPDGYLTL